MEAQFSSLQITPRQRAHTVLSRAETRVPSPKIRQAYHPIRETSPNSPQNSPHREHSFSIMQKPSPKISKQYSTPRSTVFVKLSSGETLYLDVKQNFSLTDLFHAALEKPELSGKKLEQLCLVFEGKAFDIDDPKAFESIQDIVGNTGVMNTVHLVIKK